MKYTIIFAAPEFPFIATLVFFGVSVQVTVISAMVFPQIPPRPVNIFFAICIIMICISVIILIFWYRQGNLEPKFRILIYYILISIINLCVCANLYIHEVGK
uniref:Transmembrane protein 243 n=1 Tax=Erpetoichthys calabaricus TaxID=27687 RepID=A0A8C4RRF9_ERPCA